MGRPDITAMERAIPALRDHLDRIGFVQLYKLLVTPGAYHTSPNVLSGSRPERAAGLASCVTGGAAELGLAACLMLKARVPRGELALPEQRLADLLVDAGLLVRSGDGLEMGPYQLISVHDRPLLIDGRINYPGAEAPRVYLGADSLRLAYYVDTDAIAPDDRVLDLGTGTGVIGLFLARRSEHVTMTDVSRDALALAHANRLLHRAANRVAIREEPCEETLRRRERYRVVTFNPPFLPVPDGLAAPVFARGTGPDGLGHCRALLERLDRVLLPGGTAYLVASLLGTAGGPSFVEELGRRAEDRGLRIDVYLDSSSELAAGAPIFEALGAFLHRTNPAIAREECQRRMEELQLHTLGATHAYLSVLVIRGVGEPRPSVRVFRRKAG